MDSYLESLVRKEAGAVPAEEEAVAEPVAEEITAEPEEVVTEGAQEEVVDEDPAEKAVPEPEEEAAAIDPAVTEEANAEATVNTAYTIGQTIPVTNVKVFNTPDTGQPAKLITGNIIYRGEIAGFAIIDYMRHGFGLARGYAVLN